MVAGRLVGASGTEVIEMAIHRCLDEQGVPREGRYVRVTLETITIELPKGYKIDLDPDDEFPLELPEIDYPDDDSGNL
jgi:hypothetical protein